jgi:hypothetical protein
MRLELTGTAWEQWHYEGNTILLGRRGELDDAEERRDEERCTGLRMTAGTMAFPCYTWFVGTIKNGRAVTESLLQYLLKLDT